MATSVNKIGHWKRKELWFLVIYAILFYVIIINRSLQLSRGIYLFSLCNCLFSYQLLNCRACFSQIITNSFTVYARDGSQLITSMYDNFVCCKYFSRIGHDVLAADPNAHSVLFCEKDVSDAQWRNLRGNIPVLTLVFAIFTLLANFMRAFNLRVKGMSIVWLLFSLAYLSYLHGAWYGTHALFILTFFFLSLLLFLTFISLV